MDTTGPDLSRVRKWTIRNVRTARMSANSLRVGVVMDPIESITPKKDSSLAMLLEAERRGAELHYLQQADLKLLAGEAFGRSQLLNVRDNLSDWFALGSEQEIRLGELDVILMRKDPPFDMEYIYSTYILERAENAGALIVNRPQSLDDGDAFNVRYESVSAGARTDRCKAA
jgi:glutathione synthase